MSIDVGTRVIKFAMSIDVGTRVIKFAISIELVRGLPSLR